MPKAKRSNSGNESDSDDGGFLSRFHHLPTVNVPEEPVRIINVRENTFSSSYVLTSSRTVITVSMIFSLLESLLVTSGTVSIMEMEEFESDIRIIRIAAIVVSAIFIAGEGFRIYLLSRWWGITPRCDIEPNRAYGETMKCFKNSMILIIFLICPICLLIFSAVFALVGMHDTFSESTIPRSLLLFLLCAGFDLILFVPLFACPTAICAVCFYKRRLIRHDRGIHYLEQNAT